MYKNRWRKKTLGIGYFTLYYIALVAISAKQLMSVP